MDGARQSVHDKNYVFYNLLSFILSKNHCYIKTLDLNTGLIDITGNNRYDEDKCYKDMENYLHSFMVNNYWKG